MAEESPEHELNEMEGTSPHHENDEEDPDQQQDVENFEYL